jgi:hypothetical protein
MRAAGKLSGEKGNPKKPIAVTVSKFVDLTWI